MFGYVKTNKPEMKIKEYETYRGLYCSLCKAMGRHFGVLSRLTLSYDVTFLVLARLSFSGTVPCFEGGRCPFNPTKKCNCCKSHEEELRYAAAVSMMMFYFKVRDNISDGNIFKRLLMYLILPWASIKYKKAKKMYEEIAVVVAQAMDSQKLAEEKNTDSTDEAAHASAHALGKITAYNMNDDNGDIYRFGYGIGKWVYLTDALDDMEKDLKTGSYNVFVNKYGLCVGDSVKHIASAVSGTMNMCGAFFADAYNKCENKSMTPIMENIIFDGMYKTLDNILKGKNDNERPL